MKKIFILFLLFTTMLFGCGKSDSQDTLDSWDEDNPTFLRWDTKSLDSETSVEYEDTYMESYQRRYSGNIKVTEDGPLKTLYLTHGEFDSIENLETDVTEDMEKIKEYAESFNLFTDLQIRPLTNGLQLGGVSEDNHQSYSINYYLDGKVHCVYHIDWGNYTKDIQTPDTIVERFKTYCGIEVSPGDLSKLFNDIMDLAKDDGVYELFVLDKWSYNYIALSVKDFGTSAEHWEAYASVTNTI